MTENTTAPPSEAGGFNLQRTLVISITILLVLFVLLLALAVAGAVANVEQFGPIIEVIRDIMLILLALEAALIIMALVILIAQIARLVNLLQNEVKPVLENTQQTVQHAKGTVEFVSKNLSEPVVKVNSFLAGLGVFFRESTRLQRAIQPSEPESRSDS